MNNNTTNNIRVIYELWSLCNSFQWKTRQALDLWICMQSKMNIATFHNKRHTVSTSSQAQWQISQCLLPCPTMVLNTHIPHTRGTTTATHSLHPSSCVHRGILLRLEVNKHGPRDQTLPHQRSLTFICNVGKVSRPRTQPVILQLFDKPVNLLICCRLISCICKNTYMKCFMCIRFLRGEKAGKRKMRKSPSIFILSSPALPKNM